MAAVLVGAFALAACVAFVFRSPVTAQTASPQPGVDGQEYVAAETCAVCHRAIWETYRKTGMGRSFYRPAEANAPENPSGSYYHKPSDSYFTLLWREGKYWQRRHQIGPDQREINVMEK